MTGQVIRALIVIAAMAAAAPAQAQNLNLAGPWTFTQGAMLSAGDVNVCKTNAPAGSFFAGQPVLMAHGDVDRDWRLISQCAVSVTNKVKFTVGPAPTLVEYECVLICDRDLQAKGVVSTVAYGKLNGKIKVKCTPPGALRVAVGKDAPLQDTDKVKECLQPGVAHTADAKLSISAIIDPAWLGNPHAINNCETTARNPPGLPNGLMLILQPKGICPVPPKKAFFKGDVDGDGEFALADVALLESLLAHAEKPHLGDGALAAADVAKPCTGKPDRADFDAVNAAFMAMLKDASSARKSACGGTIGRPPNE